MIIWEDQTKVQDGQASTRANLRVEDAIIILQGINHRFCSSYRIDAWGCRKIIYFLPPFFNIEA